MRCLRNTTGVNMPRRELSPPNHFEINAVFFYQRPQVLPVDAGLARRRSQVSAVFAEKLAGVFALERIDDLALELAERTTQIDRAAPRVARHVELDLLRLDLVGLSQDEGVVDLVLQLAHVPRPLVEEELLHRRGGEPLHP